MPDNKQNSTLDAHLTTRRVPYSFGVFQICQLAAPSIVGIALQYSCYFDRRNRLQQGSMTVTGLVQMHVQSGVGRSNIMFRCDKDGQILGIFIDFYLATVTDSSSVLFRNIPSSYEITGTLPFISVDRLTTQDKTHWPRHDLEPFFWLIVLFTSRHHEGKVVDNPPLQEWYRYGAELLASTKAHFRSEVVYQYSLTPHFEPLRDAWVHVLGQKFNRVIVDRNDAYRGTKVVQEAYSYETLGGSITHEKFLAILRAEIAT